MSDFAVIGVTLIICATVIAIAYIGSRTYSNTYENDRDPE